MSRHPHSLSRHLSAFILSLSLPPSSPSPSSILVSLITIQQTAAVQSAERWHTIPQSWNRQHTPSLPLPISHLLSQLRAPLYGYKLYVDSHLITLQIDSVISFPLLLLAELAATNRMKFMRLWILLIINIRKVQLHPKGRWPASSLVTMYSASSVHHLMPPSILLSHVLKGKGGWMNRRPCEAGIRHKKISTFPSSPYTHDLRHNVFSNNFLFSLSLLSLPLFNLYTTIPCR